MMSNSRVLVVGENSFIGKNLNKFDRISYKNIDTIDFSDYNVILNCALNPLYKISTYDEKNDVDYQIAKLAYENGCHNVMISTRRVYGKSPIVETYTENSTLKPFDYYGENKLNTEFKLLSNFGDKTTILRGSNIFGYEYGRNSFMGYCMSQLVNEGRIKYTISKDIVRDFIHVRDACSIIESVCLNRPTGVFNLSSNHGLNLGLIAENLILGYGYGGIFEEVANPQVEDSFILDNTKIKNELKIEIGPFDYPWIIQTLGKSLLQRTT